MNERYLALHTDCPEENQSEYEVAYEGYLRVPPTKEEWTHFAEVRGPKVSAPPVVRYASLGDRDGKIVLVKNISRCTIELNVGVSPRIHMQRLFPELP